MKFKHGEMFDFSKEQPDVLLFTGNSTINKKGELVMGRGAALQAKQKWPDLGVDLAKKMLLLGQSTSGRRGELDYGVVAKLDMNPVVGVFQVKYNWANDAELELIKFSTSVLGCLAISNWKDKSIWMNFPDIGYGRLHKDQITSIISVLPDNITVWEFPQR